jgi:hypothetical protein
MNCPELDRLIALSKAHQIYVKLLPNKAKSLIEVEFSVDAHSWRLYVDDEYKDFDERKQLICLFLTLRSLEDFAESTDYLSWCNVYHLNASHTEWLTYYRNLPALYAGIEKHIGRINSFISDLDYQLRSGAFYALLHH